MLNKILNETTRKILNRQITKTLAVWCQISQVFLGKKSEAFQHLEIKIFYVVKVLLRLFVLFFFFGGLCSGQFGWPTQQLYSVDIRQLSVEEADELRKKGFYLWYSPDQFTQEQLEWLLSGGTIRNTFGITDVDLWEHCDVFQLIED